MRPLYHLAVPVTLAQAPQLPGCPCPGGIDSVLDLFFHGFVFRERWAAKVWVRPRWGNHLHTPLDIRRHPHSGLTVASPVREEVPRDVT